MTTAREVIEGRSLWAIDQGDALACLRAMPSESVQVIVTSPPYFGLRDYGVEGQIGKEETAEEWLDALLGVFRECRRVLRKDGTFWLNCGDAYAGSGKGRNADGKPNARSAKQVTNRGTQVGILPSKRQASRTSDHGGFSKQAGRTTRLGSPFGLPAKSLLMMPARLALALQEDGWRLRSEIVWSKPSPMPESVSDRPTRSHEMIYLFSRQARYFYDGEAERGGWADARSGSDGGTKPRERGRGGREDGFTTPSHVIPASRHQGPNLRSVWTFPGGGSLDYEGEHYATFPPELPRRCIALGTSEHEVVLDPFSGSGTTVMAARRLNRRGIGIELNPKDVDHSRRRIENDRPMFNREPEPEPLQLELEA